MVLPLPLPSPPDAGCIDRFGTVAWALTFACESKLVGWAMGSGEIGGVEDVRSITRRAFCTRAEYPDPGLRRSGTGILEAGILSRRDGILS